MKSAAETSPDEHWMRQALDAAREAQTRGEVPVGTCIVSDGKLLSVSGNRTRTDCDPTAHAEIVALRDASRIAGNYRLTGVDIYSTIEPCAMCAGALIQARVRRLIYGARDERAGAVESRFRICDTDFLNHRIEIVSGVLEDECRAIMQEFFQNRRKYAFAERSHSGLVHRSRKPERLNGLRGFESHPLRHIDSDLDLRSQIKRN